MPNMSISTVLGVLEAVLQQLVTEGLEMHLVSEKMLAIDLERCHAPFFVLFLAALYPQVV